MKYKLLIPLFIAILFMSSCKKPKEGYWKATFTDDTSVSTAFYVQVQKKASSFIINEYATKLSVQGKLLVISDEITDGTVDYSGYGVGNTFSHYYTNVKGKIERKVMTGTYNYVRYESNSYSMPFDTTITGTGTFKILWVSRKYPNEQQ